MYLIKLTSLENGSRPPLQSWNSPIIPEGYCLCPDEFHHIFYSTNPAGFVNITVENNVVTSMVINQEALDTYIASLPPEQEETEIETEPTTKDILNTLLGVTKNE